MSPLKYFNYESKCQKHFYVTNSQNNFFDVVVESPLKPRMLNPYHYTCITCLSGRYPSLSSIGKYYMFFRTIPLSEHQSASITCLSGRYPSLNINRQVLHVCQDDTPVFTPSGFVVGSCFIHVICICLCILVSNTDFYI